jgi:hypothetical protein
MTDEPINLNVRRARQSGDSRDWTPLECLEDLAQRIRAGEIEVSYLMIDFGIGCPHGMIQPSFACSNVSRAERVAYLEFAKIRAITDWGG